MVSIRRFLTTLSFVIPVISLTPEANADPIIVGVTSNLAGFAVLAAQEKGFFAKNGVDVKIEIRNTGSELSKGLRASEFQFAPAAFSNVPAALERGLNVRAVVSFGGATYLRSTSDNMVAIVAADRSGIKSVADLKGKKVGVTFGTTGDLYLQQILKESGLSVDDVERINVAPPSMTSVLDTGGVDAVVTWDPYTYRTLNKVTGSNEVKRGGGYVCLCAMLHGDPDFIASNAEATQKMVDAIAEGAAFVRNPANKAEVASIGARFIDMTKEEAMQSLPNWEYDPRIGPNTADTFRTTVSLLIEQKKMKEPYDPAKYLETRFIDSTVKRHPEWFADLKQPK
jgi:ABC-type nitrate/sulfonate/bicarbonate transport system substrate-binding protein